jgi:hypothetical protein
MWRDVLSREPKAIQPYDLAYLVMGYQSAGELEPFHHLTHLQTQNREIDFEAVVIYELLRQCRQSST